ncbi:uncharacterized protein LOC144450587 [Glandiceps talaboti]
MVPLLYDLCLKSICHNLTKVGHLVKDCLPTRLKEVLLERLAETSEVYYSDTCISEFLFAPDLRNVVLRSTSFPNDLLGHLDSNSRKLKSLKIIVNASSLWRYRSSENWTPIGDCLKVQKELETLEIFYDRTDGIRVLSSIQCPNLQHFKLVVFDRFSFCHHQLEKHIETFTRTIKSLRSFEIQTFDFGVKKPYRLQNLNSSVQKIVRNFGENLVQLKLRGSSCLSKETIETISSQCPNLKEFDLRCSDDMIWRAQTFAFPTDSLSSLLCGCKQLEHLTIMPHHFNNNAESVLRISHLPGSISSLSLIPAQIVRPIFFSNLPDSLTNLAVPMVFLNKESVIMILSQLGSRLTDLDFPCKGNPSETLEHTTIQAIFDYCHNLISLGLCCFYDTSLETLHNLFTNRERASKFRCLRLFGDAEIEKSAEHVPHIAQVNSVKLLQNTAVESCKLLSKLTVNSKYTDDTLLTNIANNCPRLTHLYVQASNTNRRCPVQYGISDKGVSELASKCNLRELYLRGTPCCNITAVSLRTLANFCPYLQLLDCVPKYNGWDDKWAYVNRDRDRLRRSVMRGIRITSTFKWNA